MSQLSGGRCLTGPGDPTILRGLMLDRNLPSPRFYLAKNFADTSKRLLGYFLPLESKTFSSVRDHLQPHNS